MAVLADIAGLSLDDGDVVLRAGIEPYQSVDPVSVSTAANFSALTDSAGYGEYYSPPGLDEQSSVPQEQDGAPGARTACNPCKKNHTKCSGETPICVQCQKRKIPCSYSPQKKRGPKTGQVHLHRVVTCSRRQVKSLQEEVKQLSELVEQQRKQLAALQLSSDDARKRRRDMPALTSPDPEMRTDLAMPGFVNEYIRLFEEYIEPGCVIRDPAGARTSLDTVKMLMQLPPNDADPHRARQLLGMYTMLASGAQVFGNPVHAQEFITRARTAAQQLFDISDVSVAGGFDRITFYLIGLGDLDRARLYNGIALRMLENLDTPLQNPIHLSVMLGRGLLVKTIEERIAISNKLRESGTLNGEMLGLTLALKVKLHLFRSGEALRLEDCLPILARADELLKQRLLPERRQLTTKAMVKGLKAGVYYAAGQLAVAEQHADAATRLSKMVGSNGQYATFCVAVSMEWAAEVHHNRGKVEQLRDDCNILEAIAARFPIMTEVSRRYSALLTAMTQVPTPANAMQVPVSVEMLAPDAFLYNPDSGLGDITKMGVSDGLGDISRLPPPLGDITKMGVSEGTLERLLSTIDSADVTPAATMDNL